MYGACRTDLPCKILGNFLLRPGRGCTITFSAMRLACTAPPSPAAVHVLAELALEQLAAGRHEAARRVTEDALGLLRTAAGRDRMAAARASLLVGDALLGLHEAHRAKAAFGEAAASFDDAEPTPATLSGAAQARVGLARALVMLGDPFARAILEDAGTIYEELGDEEAVRAIDRELREIQASLDESPRSFHSASMRAASPNAA